LVDACLLEICLSIHVALNHVTHYRYDRPVSWAPQIVRLRPAPHSAHRSSVFAEGHAGEHFINWQQDPQSNYLARLVFPEPTREFKVEVDLVAEMSVINPFDFFLEPHAEKFPFAYEPGSAMSCCPIWSKLPASPLFKAFVDSIAARPTPDRRFPRRAEPAGAAGHRLRDPAGTRRADSCRKR
jgi:transglutaminase-like putative cysteine protease